MKIPTNLTLHPNAVRNGQRAAAAQHTSLSRLVEKHLLSLQTDDGEHFSPHFSKPARHPAHDQRFAYLRRKHA